MASNEKVVLCGITFDKDNAPDALKSGYPNLGYLRRMEDGTFFGDTMQECIVSLALIDDYIKDGDIFIDFVNKEVWVYTKDGEDSLWTGPSDTKFINEYGDDNHYVYVRDYKPSN